MKVAALRQKVCERSDHDPTASRHDCDRFKNLAWTSAHGQDLLAGKNAIAHRVRRTEGPLQHRLQEIEILENPVTEGAFPFECRPLGVRNVHEGSPERLADLEGHALQQLLGWARVLDKKQTPGNLTQAHAWEGAP